MTNVAEIKRAADYIDAVELSDGRWAHYDNETSTWWIVTADELAELTIYLDSDDETVSSDAYSHWCAGGTGSEMPKGWTPDTDTTIYEFSANGMVFGNYTGDTLDEAKEAFATDAGYATWAAMVEQAEEFGGNNVEIRERCENGRLEEVNTAIEDLHE